MGHQRGKCRTRGRWAPMACKHVIPSGLRQDCSSAPRRGGVAGAAAYQQNSTTSAPMPEMYGETAFLYRAGNSEELAHQVDAAMGLDVAQRSSQQSAARRRAAEFSWQRTMEETVQQLLLTAGRTERLRAAA